MTTHTVPITRQDPQEREVSPVARSPWRRVLPDTAYALASFPLSLVAFVVGVCGFALGVSTLIIWIGLPILVGTVMATRGFAVLERARVRSSQGGEVAAPVYLAAEPGASRVRRALTPLRDVQSWLDLLWSGTGLVTGTLAFSIVLSWWAAALGGLTYWYWQRWIPDADNTLAEVLGMGSGRGPEILLNSIFGVVAVLTLPWATRFAAWVHSSLARALLDSRAELQAEVRRAVGARRAAQVAEVDALRRLERDIHDGPQQRLVRLSMDLGRARRHIDSDPARAGEIIDAALIQARETVEELRSLSRGIAPPLLVDRGLAAALAEVAARHTSDVALRVEVPHDLSATVETTIYYVVCECLTNVAKHAQATTVGVDVVTSGDGERIEVSVRDDGVGGADLAKGQGLAGLATRLEAVGGTLAVTSPPAGPTVVRAEVGLSA